MNESSLISVTAHPYPCQHLMLSVFWIVAILISVLWYLDAVVDFRIFNALMTYDVAHLHVWLFNIFTTSWVKYLSRCLIHFLIGLFHTNEFREFLHILEKYMTVLYQMSTQSTACLLIFLVVSFTKKILTYWSSSYHFFLSWTVYLILYLKSSPIPKFI